MITKNDCLLLLADIKESAKTDTLQKEVDKMISTLITANYPPLTVIEFINKNRQLDLTKFYHKIRKSYNHKHSRLYGNIVKEIDDVNEVLTTLSALETQILLFAKEVEDREMFIRHSRAEEISKVLTNYYETFSLTNCIRLLRLIKADIKSLESFS